MIYAFDFEWTNKNIMYGSYKRTVSVFQNSDMMAKGTPSPEELALLEPFRGQVPDEVFGEPFVPPVSDGSGQDRALLRKAAVLLQAAGIVLKDGKRVTPKGERITIEFLIDEPTFQPHHLPFIKNLATLGIEATLRIVDPVQYRARVDDFDFDMTIERFGFSLDAGRRLAALLLLAGGRDQGLAESRRHRRSGDRRADRARSSRRRRGRDADHRLPGARPRDPRRPLLGAALVQGVALDRLLGHVRPSRRQSRATLAAFRRPGGTTATRRRRSSGPDSTARPQRAQVTAQADPR